jgi:hypothetical protein
MLLLIDFASIPKERTAFNRGGRGFFDTVLHVSEHGHTVVSSVRQKSFSFLEEYDPDMRIVEPLPFIGSHYLAFDGFPMCEKFSFAERDVFFTSSGLI